MKTHNYAKLRGRIKEICNTQAMFAYSMEMSPTAISEKLNDRSEWSQKEILKACDVLRIDKVLIPEYFFAE